MRLTPDCSKMLISTSSGYLLILHDLDLTQSLEIEETDFSPYCVSVDGGTSASRSAGTPRQGNDSSKIHPPREGLPPRNSLEVLTPEIPGERDRGNCITSLQLHPKGWAALIRCSSNMDDQEVRNASRPLFKEVDLADSSPASGGPGFPLPALVEGLGAGAKHAEPQGAETQLQVLGKLPSLGPDLVQPLDGRFGQAEVTDGGAWLHSNAAPPHGRVIALGPNHHFVVPRVQEAPVVAVGR
ncbi:DDB1- and CUL4-associated factor 10 [Liparis tanakae]|uniref:DDB1-and CUL4-associated factor 10 n=1 Tax=Liparis tanakae TaxID=230148 RepID=A0A4Z2GCV8_9TELE|nr:DDB1- and CUL4-associated factor 10 [Liparis tanakae]